MGTVYNQRCKLVLGNTATCTGDVHLILQPLTDNANPPKEQEKEKATPLEASLRHGRQRSKPRTSEKPMLGVENTANASREPTTATAVQLSMADLTRIRCPAAAHNTDARFQLVIMARDRQTNMSPKQDPRGQQSHVSLANGGAARTGAAAGVKGETTMTVKGRELLVAGDEEAEAGCQAGQREPKEVAPFGVLSAESDEVLCALVLGVASVR